LRANRMWQLVETAEATLISGSMTSELRGSAERWFPQQFHLEDTTTAGDGTA
jgi:hypothetical protein